MDRLGSPTRLQLFGYYALKLLNGKNPKDLLNEVEARSREKRDRMVKESKEANALRKKMAGTERGRAYDRLAEVMKKYGSSPGAMRQFFDSAEGKAAMRELGRAGDTVAEGQLRARGLSDEQIGKLRDHVFGYARNTIASRMDDKVKQAATEIGGLIRDADKRGKLIASLKQMKTEKERFDALGKLGISGETAKRIARSPHGAEAELVRGLKGSAESMETLHRECLMAMQDDTRALGLFAATRKGTDALRKALGVPSDGSFAGNCVDKGLADAKSSKETEALVKKLAMALASITSGGILASVVVSVTPALDRLGQAKTKRQVAQGGAALGLSDRATVERARREEHHAQKELRGAAIKGAVIGTLAHGAGALGHKAAEKLGGRILPTNPEHAAETLESLVEKGGELAASHE